MVRITPSLVQTVFLASLAPLSAFIRVHRRPRTLRAHPPRPHFLYMKIEDPDLLTHQVLAAIFEVSNTLGARFLEKVYKRTLLTELPLPGLRATSEAPLEVTC